MNSIIYSLISFLLISNAVSKETKYKENKQRKCRLVVYATEINSNGNLGVSFRLPKEKVISISSYSWEECYMYAWKLADDYPNSIDFFVKTTIGIRNKLRILESSFEGLILIKWEYSDSFFNPSQGIVDSSSYKYSIFDESNEGPKKGDQRGSRQAYSFNQFRVGVPSKINNSSHSNSVLSYRL